jgi:hypothetical protein
LFDKDLDWKDGIDLYNILDCMKGKLERRSMAAAIV